MKKFNFKKFIGPLKASKKFKGVQKLPAQKTPSRFSAMHSDYLAQQKTRDVFGELPEFMGMSQRATGELAAESLAIQTSTKKFFRTLPKELGRSRARTATGLKTIRQTRKVPKPAIIKAKSKGAMKSYNIAVKKESNVFKKTMETFTGKGKSSPFITRSIKTKPKTMSQEAGKRMGIDDRDVSAMRSNEITIKSIDPKTGKLKFKSKRIGGTFTDYTETIKFDKFKKKK